MTQTVLLVEDNALELRPAPSASSTAGLRICEALSGRAAPERAEPAAFGRIDRQGRGRIDRKRATEAGRAGRIAEPKPTPAFLVEVERRA